MSKNIYKKLTPIWPLLPVETGSQCLIFEKNHIWTTTRGKLKIVAPLYRSLIVKKYLQDGDPNLTFICCPNRKWMCYISKYHISTTTRGKFTIFAPLYRSLIVIKYVSKMYPNFTFSFCRRCWRCSLLAVEVRTNTNCTLTFSGNICTKLHSHIKQCAGVVPESPGTHTCAVTLT